MSARLSRRTKLLYGVADIGGTLSFVALNTWLLYFLINIVGLAPLWAGVVFIVGRVFDALLDPLMGALSDRWKSRYGRLAFIRWGALPLGLSFALVWLSPAGPFAFVFAILAFMLFSFFYTVVQVPYMALTPELAPEYDERTELSSYRIAFSVLASLLAVALPPLIVGLASPGDLASSDPSGWLLMGLVFGGVCALAYLIMAFGLQEPQRQAGTVRAEALWPQYRAAFSIYGFRSIFALFIVITVGIMVVNSVLPFYLESALRFSPSQQSLVLGSLFGVAILAFPLWTLLAARLGKRSALALGLGLLAVSLVLIVNLAEPARLSLRLFLPLGLAGVGLSAVMLFPWAMLPDVLEFGELQQGIRREGLVYALFTFGQKLAGSAGVFANALVASLFGYQPGAAAQSESTVQALSRMTGPVAAAVLLVALILTFRFPITRAKHEEARARLRDARP